MGNSWSHVRPIIGNHNRVDRFLHHLYKEEITANRHRSNTEIHDIGSAVSDMVGNIINTSFANHPVLPVSRNTSHKHVVGVGSFFETTKIKDYNEFDFTFVLPYFSDENVRVVKELNSPIHTCKHGIKKDPFAYVELEYCGRNTSLLQKHNLLTSIKARRYLVACQLFSVAREMVDKCLANKKNVQEISRDTGTLYFQGKNSVLNGPAMMLKFKWYQNSGDRDLDITVDIVPAVKARLPPRMFHYITAPYIMKKEISDVTSCLFIPKNKPNVSVDFVISFCHIETRLIHMIKAEKPQWYYCFCLLKYIFWDQKDQTPLNSNPIFSTYILKNLLMQEALICDEKYITLVECFIKMLIRLQRYTDTLSKGTGTHIEIRSGWFLDSSIACKSLKDRYDRKELEIMHMFLDNLIHTIIDIDRCQEYEYCFHKAQLLNVIHRFNMSMSDLKLKRAIRYSQASDINNSACINL